MVIKSIRKRSQRIKKNVIKKNDEIIMEKNDIFENIDDLDLNKLQKEQYYDSIFEYDCCSFNIYDQICITSQSEIEKFIREFSIFQNNHNIGKLSNQMNPTKWLMTDSFIFLYINTLISENKISNVLNEYGIAKGFKRLFHFYQKELNIPNLQTDTKIVQHMISEKDTSISIDMVVAILREAIGFVPLDLIK